MMVQWIGSIIWIGLETIFVYGLSSFVFDLAHVAAHRCLKSKRQFFKNIGQFHRYHHQFYSAQLKINPKFIKKNLIYQVLPEYLFQIGATLSCLIFMPPLPILCACFFVKKTVWRGQSFRLAKDGRLVPW